MLHSSALDGSEDDMLWNDTKDDGERGNESKSTSSGHNIDDSEYDEQRLVETVGIFVITMSHVIAGICIDFVYIHCCVK